MTLGQQQRHFALMIGELLVWIYEQGYEVTFGDAWAKTGHKDDSFHYKHLAKDLNLYKDGAWLTETEGHAEIGRKWKEMGGSWGGDFRRKDGNHYSYGKH